MKSAVSIMLSISSSLLVSIMCRCWCVPCRLIITISVLSSIRFSVFTAGTGTTGTDSMTGVLLVVLAAASSMLEVLLFLVVIVSCSELDVSFGSVASIVRTLTMLELKRLPPALVMHGSLSRGFGAKALLSYVDRCIRLIRGDVFSAIGTLKCILVLCIMLLGHAIL